MGNEIRNKQDIILAIILNKLGLNKKRIAARKCEISRNRNNEFFENNHLMGLGRGEQKFLIYEDQPVIGIQYFRCFDKKVKKKVLKIDRLCSAPSITVMGGYSKLIAEFQEPISSFVDLRYGTGEYLAKLGFKMISCNPSFKWVYGANTFHRSLSIREPELVKVKKMAKLWDCGQAHYFRDYS